jgi:hypothetical protein
MSAAEAGAFDTRPRSAAAVRLRCLDEQAAVRSLAMQMTARFPPIVARCLLAG